MNKTRFIYVKGSNGKYIEVDEDEYLKSLSKEQLIDMLKNIDYWEETATTH